MAPRLSRLASTISRDDSIAVIGAGDPLSSASGDVRPCLLCFSLIAHLCQESRGVPSPRAAARPHHPNAIKRQKSLTLSSIYLSLGQQVKNDRGYPRPAAGGSA